MRSIPTRVRVFGVALGALLVGGLAVAVPAANADQKVADDRQTAIVSLGDSAISG
jgi:hypothetical protein